MCSGRKKEQCNGYDNYQGNEIQSTSICKKKKTIKRSKCVSIKLQKLHSCLFAKFIN